MTDHKPVRGGKRAGWGLMWHSDNRLDGCTRHLMWENLMPLLFSTRAEAREFAKTKYGYIAASPGLLNEPHGWKPPKVVRAQITVEELQ